MLVLVSYDLRAPGRDYTTLIAQIKKLGAIRPLESMWLVKTSSTPEQIRDFLKQYMDANDRLFVTKCGSPAAWVGMGDLTVTLQNLYIGS